MILWHQSNQRRFLWFIVLCFAGNKSNGVVKWKHTEFFTQHLSIQGINKWYNFSDSNQFRENCNQLGTESLEVQIFGRFTEQEKKEKSWYFF